MRLLAVVALLALVGCASQPIVGTHPTKTENDLYADHANCEAISQIYVPYGGMMLPTVHGGRYQSCMMGKGWRQAQQ